MINELLGIQYNIAKANATDGKVQNLASYINVESLKAIHKTMDKNKAGGIDRVTKEEYEQKIKDLGELTSVFEDGLEWGWDFWQENDYDDESVGYGIYREIQEEVLNWQQSEGGA